MAHKRLNYLDVPPSRRKVTAAKALGRLQEILNNPVLTKPQVQVVLDKIAHLNKWASGGITLKVEEATLKEEVVTLEEVSLDVASASKEEALPLIEGPKEETSLKVEVPKVSKTKSKKAK